MAERLEELLAREAIRDKLYLYCRAVDRRDGELLAQVFHPDGFDAHPTVFVGNAKDFVDFIIPRHIFASSQHSISNPLIEVRGDRAFCESHITAHLRVALPGNQAVDITSVGRYLDVFERRDGDWRILHRLVINGKRTTQMVSELDRQGLFRIDESDGMVATADRRDPVYRGFGILDIRPPDFRVEGETLTDELARRYAGPTSA